MNHLPINKFRRARQNPARWKVDYARARLFDPEIRRVMQAYLGLEFFRVQAIEGERDCRYGEDYGLVHTNGGVFANRIRGLDGGIKHLNYWDMAIRGETEEHKIREGDCPSRYLYSWVEPGTLRFSRWMLVATEPIRANRLLDFARRRPDPYEDGRTFLLIPLADLKRTQAIIMASWPWYDDKGECKL